MEDFARKDKKASEGKRKERTPSIKARQDSARVPPPRLESREDKGEEKKSHWGSNNPPLPSVATEPP